MHKIYYSRKVFALLNDHPSYLTTLEREPAFISSSRNTVGLKTPSLHLHVLQRLC